jgi:hypothetical protein
MQKVDAYENKYRNKNAQARSTVTKDVLLVITFLQ